MENAGLNFENLNIIDIGCGSGLFSLVALRLGAKHITCFDYDPDSVKCAEGIDIPEFSEDHLLVWRRYSRWKIYKITWFDLVYNSNFYIILET